MIAAQLTCSPAKAGVQHRAGCNWTPAFAGEQDVRPSVIQ